MKKYIVGILLTCPVEHRNAGIKEYGKLIRISRQQDNHGNLISNHFLMPTCRVLLLRGVGRTPNVSVQHYFLSRCV